MTPEEVAHEVDRPACSAGAGPASRPAANGPCSARARSPTWSSTETRASRPPSRTTCSSSGTRTSSSRACVIAAYAAAGQPGLHLHPRRVRPRARACPSRPQRRLRPWRGGDRHLRVRVLGRRGRPPGRRRLYLRGGDRPARVARGQARLPRIKPPYFPAAIGLYGEPTVVNNVETMSNLPWIVLHGGAAFAALGEGRSAGTRLFALAGHVNNPGVFEIEMVKTTFDDLINAPVLGGGMPRRSEPQGLHPRRGVGAVVRTRPDRPPPRPGRGGSGRFDARVRVDGGDGRPHLCGAGGLAHHQVLRPRVVRAVHALPRGVGLARADHVAHRDAARGARRTSISCSTRATTSPRGWPGRRSRPPSACSAPPSLPPSHSAIEMFRDEFLVHIKDGGCPYE